MLLLLAVLVGPVVPAATKPNVLLICVDDLKPAIGAYGDPHAKTPNLDRLAARGVRFDAAYCNQAVCAPSRNALLTGLRPQTVGIYDLGTNFRKATPHAVTLGQYFQKHGYRTGAVGKIFHVGHGNQEDPASWSEGHFPARSIDYARPENLRTESREEALFANRSAAGRPRGAAWERADVPDETYGDGKVAGEAVRRLKEAAQQPGQPFLLAVGFLKPHLPFCAPERYWRLHDPATLPSPTWRKPPEGAPGYAVHSSGELRNYEGIPPRGELPEDLQRTLVHGYYAATSYMDAMLGRVLDALEETGLASRTVVALWGDHGYHLGDHGLWNKHTNYEQATRVPLIVAGPGVATGVHSAAMIETVDLYPTLAELTGLPGPAGLDGRSFRAVLHDPATAHRDHVTHVFPRGARLGRAVRTNRHRLVEWKVPGAAAATAEYELYDYEEDPAETRNLVSERPQVQARLLALLSQQPEARPPWKATQGAKAAGAKPTS
jgi:iduronate 2-sulfatase